MFGKLKSFGVMKLAVPFEEDEAEPAWYIILHVGEES